MGENGGVNSDLDFKIASDAPKIEVVSVLHVNFSREMRFDIGG